MDLSSQDARQAYRQELRTVARGWRWTGLGLITLAAIGLFLTRSSVGAAGGPRLLETVWFVLLVVGWAFALIGIWKRTAYHRTRMRKDIAER